MPRRQLNQPVTLKDASLQNIACHFESYWCTGKSVNYRRLQKCLEPFEYLNDAMTQEILDILDQKILLRSHHVQLLLSSNIRRLQLDLMMVPNGHYSIVQTLGVRCRKLTHLDLLYAETNTNALCSMFTNLPELVSLTLGHKDTNLKVFKGLAENCRNLLELTIHMSWVHRCQDNDIKEFANISKTFGFSKLKSLGLGMTEITVDTVVALLQSQKSLETFSHTGNIHEAFGLMYGKKFQQTKDVPLEWIVPLLRLRIKCWGKRSLCTLSENTCLELTFRCCPYVTELSLFDLTDHTSLSHVSKLRHLNTLRILGTVDLPINFPKYLLPVFIKLGNNCTMLDLYLVSEINVITIGTLCPNLESLCITPVQSEQYHISDNPVVCYKHLTRLSIHARFCENSVSEGQLSTTLVNGSQLRRISLTDCNLTDDIISKATQIHGFKHLEQAFFTSCNLISAKTGMMLLSTDSPLERLMLHTCENINDSDEDLLRQEISRMEYNVQLDIY